MARRDGGLISQIQRDALDESVSVASALRKCLVLGGESGSVELRAWATRELQGYGPEDELPDYRVIRAPLLVDGFAGMYQVSRQQIAASSIPDFAQEKVSETLELRSGVGALEALLENAEIKLQPPFASDLVRYMNATSGSHIVSLYWGVAHAEIRGVLDQIRTALVRLVVELRASVPDENDVPPAEVTNQAVNVVINGEKSSVQITTAQATGTGSSATASGGASELTALLDRLEAAFRGAGDAETAEKVAHMSTLVENPRPDENKLRQLWGAVKIAATTNEAVTLVNHIAPLLFSSGPLH